MEYVYGALLLHKVGKDINDDNLHKVISATGTQVDESKIKTLVASLKGVNIDKELESASLMTSAPVEGHAEAKKEEKKEDKKQEASAAAEGLSALFG